MVFLWRANIGPLSALLVFVLILTPLWKKTKQKKPLKFGPLWQNLLDPRMAKDHCLLSWKFNISTWYRLNLSIITNLCSWAEIIDSYLVRNPKSRGP